MKLIGTKSKIMQGISINVILLGIASFMMDMSSEIIHPLLPFFITSLGGAGLAIGLIGGLGESSVSILTVLSGYFSDKSGKRMPFIFSGYLTSAISKIILAFSTVWQHVLILRPVERMGKGLRTAPRDAIIADSTENGNFRNSVRGKAFGIHRAMDSAGAILGSVLALLLFWLLGMNLRDIFLIAGFIGLLSIIPLFLVKDEKRKPLQVSLGIGIKSLPARFRLFLIIVTIFAFGNFTYMFMILKAQESFGLIIAIILYIFFNIFYTSFSVPFGMLSDRIGRKNVLISGYALFGVTCIGFIFLRTLPEFFLLFGLYGLVYAMVEGTQRAFASDLINSGMRGTGLGTFHTVIALATLPSSVIAGALWQYSSPEATFLYGSIMGFIAALLFVAAGKRIQML